LVREAPDAIGDRFARFETRNDVGQSFLVAHSFDFLFDDVEITPQMPGGTCRPSLVLPPFD
jgi:hypothetical protein